MFRGIGSAAYLFAARALTVIYQLRFVEHTFGVGYGGLIVLLNQFTFYILLAELGLANATTSLLFEPVHQNQLGQAKALIEALRADVRRLVRWIGLGSCIAVAGLSLWLHQQIPLATLAVSLLLTCASALITFTALPYQSLFNATERVPVRNVVLGTGFLAKVVLGIVLARHMHSFIGLPLGTALVAVVEVAVQRRLVMPPIDSAVTTIEAIQEARTSIRSRAKFVLFHRVGYLITYQSDYIILLLSSSLPLLAYYAQYQYIYAGMLSFTLAVASTLTARVARQQLTVGKQGFRRLYRTTSLLSAVAAAICGLAFFFLTRPLVHVLYRVDRADHWVIFLFAVMLMLNVLKSNDDIWIDTTGAYSTGFYLPLLESCSYIAFGLLLVHRFQMSGVLYANIATNLLFSVLLKSFVLGKGVMEREVQSTMAVKLFNLAGVAGAFSGVVLLVQVLVGTGVLR